MFCPPKSLDASELLCLCSLLVPTVNCPISPTENFFFGFYSSKNVDFKFLLISSDKIIDSLKLFIEFTLELKVSICALNLIFVGLSNMYGLLKSFEKGSTALL